MRRNFRKKASDKCEMALHPILTCAGISQLHGHRCVQLMTTSEKNCLSIFLQKSFRLWEVLPVTRVIESRI